MAYQTRTRGRFSTQNAAPAPAASTPLQTPAMPQIVFNQAAPAVDTVGDTMGLKTDVEPSEDGYEDMMDAEETTVGEARPKKWINKKKDPNFKVSKKVRRKRMNARLRRLLQPKNAIMVLNEMSESVKFTFHEPLNPANTLFAVSVEVDSQVFTGQGLSKPLAKQQAAENALRSLLLEKMSQTEVGNTEGAEVAMPEEESKANISDVPPGEEPPLLDQEGRPVNGQQVQPEDDVPWGSLASFALYKLFNEWQSQGINVNFKPATKPVPGQPTEQGRTVPAPMKKLPDNPTDRHPVMLLNQLRPAAVFEDAGQQGVPPNMMFTVSVNVDGASYQGIGKNKKEAKKEAAKQALATIFDVHYDN